MLDKLEDILDAVAQIAMIVCLIVLTLLAIGGTIFLIAFVASL